MEVEQLKRYSLLGKKLLDLNPLMDEASSRKT
jgi:hypothetical protein